MSDNPLQIMIYDAARRVFGPTLDLLGVKVRDGFQNLTFKAQRRLANLAEHYRIVGKSVPIPKNENLSAHQLKLIDLWIDEAQDVGPESPELAKMWQNVLEGILQNDEIDEALIKIMGQVDLSMAKMLLEFYYSPKNRSPIFRLRQLIFGGIIFCSPGKRIFSANRLITLGLLERYYSISIFSGITAILMTFIAFFTYLYAGQAGPVYSLIHGTSRPSIAIKISIVIFLLSSLSGIIGIIASRYLFRATWSAKKLLKYAPEKYSVQT